VSAQRPSSPPSSRDVDELAPHDLRLRGVRVTYFDVGAEGAQAVVLLHGLGLSRMQWASTVRSLAAHRRVIALDFPGFGDSEAPPASRYSYTYEGLAETVVDLVAALGLGRVSLVGHGMGAGVAIVIAADRPEFVDRLVLVAAPCYRTPRPLGQRLVEVPLLGPVLFERILGSTVVRPHVIDAERAGGPRIDHGSPTSATFAMLRRTSAPATLEARLPRVRTPTLVVWGRDDRISPWTHGSRLAREINGTRLEILECGHAPEAERPRQFGALVTEFLAEDRGSTSTRLAPSSTTRAGRRSEHDRARR
jgi:pimeloyl-ACP methyl ester carboxylesterase